VGLLIVNGGFKPRPRVSAERNVPVSTEQHPAVPNTVAVTPPAGPAMPDGAGPQRLLVRAIEPTWIRIQTDDLRAVQELLAPGATREWTAERRFLLTVGNAGGIEVELNGQPMPRLGQSGAVIRQLELPKAAAAGS